MSLLFSFTPTLADALAANLLAFLAAISFITLTLSDPPGPGRRVRPRKAEHMSQDFQSIGSASSELDAVAAQHQGHPDDPIEPQIEEFTSHDFSFYDRRANRQGQFHSVPNMASNSETPTAAQPVSPFNPYSPDL